MAFERLKKKIEDDKAKRQLEAAIKSGFEAQSTEFVKFNKKDRYYGKLLKDVPEVILRKSDKAPEIGQILADKHGYLIKICDFITDSELEASVDGRQYAVACRIFKVEVLSDPTKKEQSETKKEEAK